MPSMRRRVERVAQLRDAPASRVVAVHDDLGEHRVVVRRDLGAALDPGVDAHVRRGSVTSVSRPELGWKSRAGILGVEARLDRVRRAVGCRQLVERRQLAGRQAHHPLDEIDAGDLLGDAVLDLQARVDLEEVELAARRRRSTNSTVPAER